MLRLIAAIALGVVIGHHVAPPQTAAKAAPTAQPKMVITDDAPSQPARHYNCPPGCDCKYCVCKGGECAVPVKVTPVVKPVAVRGGCANGVCNVPPAKSKQGPVKQQSACASGSCASGACGAGRFRVFGRRR